MSQMLIQKYLNDLSDLRKASGSVRESIVSEAFKDLLKGYAKSHDLIFIPQYELPRQAGNRRIVDGALVYDLRVPFGYWEAKDEADKIDKEIAIKLKRGYPRDNIIFEDSRIAVLLQDGNEAMRCPVDDVEKLGRLLNLFFKYERAEVANFRKAVLQFQIDLPNILNDLRAMIESAHTENPLFRRSAVKFLKHAQETINPAVTADDVREMLIQHILTEEIFSKVFDEDDFHRQNNVAKELYALEGLFFTGALKKKTLKGLEPYYNAIRTTAHQIGTHTEKQTFLKVIYEGFYKAYNRKAADRLGVVYTPNEIVRFMVESADWLCQKYFAKSLIDRDVQILDPATGTGTFICELLEHFRGQKLKLAHKYKEELHANEVAILPYYVANLNIEATYAAIMGSYAEFPNLCFVDTLDNVAGLNIRAGHQHDLFGAMSEENVARIKRQNGRKISVVIGNPPYNANQQNENDDNKNRSYPRIDERIKNTYIKLSNAQKTKAYDMYTRFFRWASDRLHDDGVLAFITNRSFVDSRTMDGFRLSLAKEYNHIYVVDLGGDVRMNPKLSGTRNNVFGIQTGVAISFLVKRRLKKNEKHSCEVHYIRRPEMETAEDKLAWLDQAKLKELPMDAVHPDAKSNWINITNNDFQDLIPLASKSTKEASKKSLERAVFKTFSNGINTARDGWVVDLSTASLAKKVKYFLRTYNSHLESGALGDSIKLSRNLKTKFSNGSSEAFSSKKISKYNYRPFFKPYCYLSELMIDELGSWRLFPSVEEPTLVIPNGGDFRCLAALGPVDFHFIGDARVIGLHVIRNGEKIENITDWALKTFAARYGRTKPSQKSRVTPITKSAIFDYVYAVLHDPIYRDKYAQDLKRELPNIPLYDDFWKWATWGRRLIKAHTSYELAKPWKLKRIEKPGSAATRRPAASKPILRIDKENGIIDIDEVTKLTGIPAEAWTYRLGNRSAIEWVLDQYKEKEPKDKNIRLKFNDYKFSDYKETVISLLSRVTTVSVETSLIQKEMIAKRG